MFEVVAWYVWLQPCFLSLCNVSLLRWFCAVSCLSRDSRFDWCRRPEFNPG